MIVGVVVVIVVLLPDDDAMGDPPSPRRSEVGAIGVVAFGLTAIFGSVSFWVGFGVVGDGDLFLDISQIPHMAACCSERTSLVVFATGFQKRHSSRKRPITIRSAPFRPA